MTASTMSTLTDHQPAYQVEFLNICKGRRVAATKRRIRWRFGFSDRAAIGQGLSNIDCRGEEHEVVFLWSIASGKQRILADGVEVHFGSGSRMSDRFEKSWTMNGGHELKIVAHATQPLRKSTGNFRQFDLVIDGRSFDDLPQIYELGRESTTSTSTSASAWSPAKRIRSTPHLYRMGSCPISPSPASELLKTPSSAGLKGMTTALRKPDAPRRSHSLPMHLLSLDAAAATHDLISFDDDDSTTASLSPSSSCSVFDDLYHQQQRQQLVGAQETRMPRAVSQGSLLYYPAGATTSTSTPPPTLLPQHSALVSPEPMPSGSSWSFSFSPEQQRPSFVNPKDSELEVALNSLVNLEGGRSSPLPPMISPKPTQLHINIIPAHY